MYDLFLPTKREKKRVKFIEDERKIYVERKNIDLYIYRERSERDGRKKRESERKCMCERERESERAKESERARE